MRITSFPEDYSGVLAPVIYEISEVGSNEATEVLITDSDDNVCGVKRLYGEDSYKVNVANYVSEAIQVAPLAHDKSGFVKAAKRTAYSGIRVGEVVTHKSILCAGKEKCPAGELLSNSPETVKLSPGDCDELAFIAEAGVISASAKLEGVDMPKELDLGSVDSEGGLYVFVIDSAQIATMSANAFEDYKYMTIGIFSNDGEIARRRYRIEPRNKASVRMCWQNTYGQIDYYTLELREEYRAVKKSRARTGAGYLVTGISCDSTYTLASECETGATVEWLEEILSSPKVWIEGGNGFEAVDVVTSKATINKQRPNAITIDVRSVKEETLKIAGR